MDDAMFPLIISILTLLSVWMFICFGWPVLRGLLQRQNRWYEKVLVRQLLIDIHPPVAVGLSVAAVVVTGVLAQWLLKHYLWFLVGATLGALVPWMIVQHLEVKRRERLDRQLIDGIATLASGVRAGLNLVQSMEMLVHNTIPPLKEEFAQLLREYQMGLDLNQAMHNAADRIGSSHFRLLFVALQIHRQRGGDVGDSLDRIGESIREIQRLEGKLDAVTATGRYQAMMIAGMPVVLTAVMYTIDREGVMLLFELPLGRVLLLCAVVLIAVAFLWIQNIMDVDI